MEKRQITNSLYGKVTNYIAQNRERFLNDLFEVLRIPSISAQSEHKPDMVRCASIWPHAS